MFSFFSATETHPEAKTFADYYDALAKAVQDVKSAVPDANQDADFVLASKTISELVLACRLIESVPAMEANTMNAKRKEILKKIGPDGIMGVSGEASRMLAVKYANLLVDVLEKVYWPNADCPTVPVLGKSFLTEYASSFEARKPSMNRTIDILEERIKAYDDSKHLTKRM